MEMEPAMNEILYEKLSSLSLSAYIIIGISILNFISIMGVLASAWMIKTINKNTLDRIAGCLEKLTVLTTKLQIDLGRSRKNTRKSYS